MLHLKPGAARSIFRYYCIFKNLQQEGINMDTITGLNGGTWDFIHSMTYGEMIISILLVVLLGFKFVELIFQVFRWWW